MKNLSIFKSKKEKIIYSYFICMWKFLTMNDEFIFLKNFLTKDTMNDFLIRQWGTLRILQK